jgi:hypothetical protein
MLIQISHFDTFSAATIVEISPSKRYHSIRFSILPIAIGIARDKARQNDSFGLAKNHWN